MEVRVHNVFCSLPCGSVNPSSPGTPWHSHTPHVPACFPVARLGDQIEDGLFHVSTPATKRIINPIGVAG